MTLLEYQKYQNLMRVNATHFSTSDGIEEGCAAITNKTGVNVDIVLISIEAYKRIIRSLGNSLAMGVIYLPLRICSNESVYLVTIQPTNQIKDNNAFAFKDDHILGIIELAE